MKKFLSLFVIFILIFALPGCGIDSGKNDINQEKSNVESTSNGAKQIRYCATKNCNGIINDSSTSLYCADRCRCRAAWGCPMPRKDPGYGSYCITHECSLEGCTSERTSGSNFCPRHQLD